MSTPTDVKPADPTLSLLQRIVDEAMDPGYLEAHERGDIQTTGRRHSLAISVVLCLLAILVVAAVLQVRAGAPSDGNTRADLVERVGTATQSLNDIQRRVERLTTSADNARAAALTGSASDQALSNEVASLESQVGGGAVTGPGVRITLQDGPPAPAGEGGPDLARVLDTDVQLVVNGLFAAGAEAVSVNGQRVTVLSPIRSAGEAVLVGFRPLTPPYEVTAVGSDNLAADFEAGQARAELAGLESTYGIGVDITPVEEATVPGRSDLQIRYADELRSQSDATEGENAP